MPLYLLTGELLATHIRTHQGVKGFQHPQATPKISQSADDTTLLLADDTSITNAFQVFQAYEAASRARINLQKCKGLWSGSYRARTDTPTPFEWTNTSLPDKLLGLYVGNTDCTNQNLESKIHKLRNITAAWRHHDLSLKGRELCEGLVTIQELTEALKLMNRNKSPGPDGLTAELYSFFWSSLGPVLVQVLNESYRESELCESTNVSVTRLVHKSDDKRDLKNWRPISLFNLDYKIGSKALSLRLSKVLEVIIDSDQSCSVPNRSIFFEFSPVT